jgi:lipopolysaccharide heptosyltransferase II
VRPDAGPRDAPAPPERVLIVLFGAIGDVVRGLPLAQQLHTVWPASRIAWAVEPAAAPLLDGHPALDRVIVFRRERGLRAFPPFLRQVRAYDADLALDLQRLFKSGLTSWYSGARLRIGFGWRNAREGNWFFNNEHIDEVERFSPKTGHFLAFADHLGLPPAPVSFGLGLRPDERARVDGLLGDTPERFAAVFVGSTWPSRYWFPEPTAALCRALRERGLGVVLVGVEADAGFASEVAARGAGAVTNLVGRTTLRDVIGLLERAAVAVGPDSGPMHVAAAVGTPVVSLWGATSPARSMPYGCDDLVVVGEAPCVPCYRRECPIGRVCMESISAERVAAVVDRALERHA